MEFEPYVFVSIFLLVEICGCLEAREPWIYVGKTRPQIDMYASWWLDVEEAYWGIIFLYLIIGNVVYVRNMVIHI